MCENFFLEVVVCMNIFFGISTPAGFFFFFKIIQYLLNPFPREEDTKLQQSQGDRSLGISICLGCHIVKPFGKMNVLTKQNKERISERQG